MIKTLNQALQNSCQAELANMLGATQGAISLAVRKNRKVFIIENEGQLSAFEIKPVFQTNPNLENVINAIQTI